MMKHAIAGLALAFALAGCGGSPKKATAPAASCADAAANTQALVMTGAGADMHVANIMGKVITEQCTSAAWSADTIACMATATADTMAGCSDKLTAAQKDSFTAAVATEMGAASDDAPPANEFDNPCGE